MTSIGETSKVIDHEHLQQLSYERSKRWATFLDSIAESENKRALELDELDTLFGQMSDDDEDDLASMEDENYDSNVDPEVLRDITNSTRLALMINGTINSTAIQNAETLANEGNNELIDLFNQTLPVINEHNRQMKESGFDRILNSFDAKKIEEKVGGWLRRHNSLCADDYTMINTAQDKRKEHPYRARNRDAIEHLHRTPAYRTTRPYKTCYPEDESDSDDSFNSGETARYIRSSRTGAMKNSSSTTMMIKTYRMVKSTRQALRDKYACDQDVDADSHLDELRHRRRLAKELGLRHRSEKQHSRRNHIPYYQYMTPTLSTHSQRRKILRKRTASNSCSAVDSSSESDSYYYDEGGTLYHRNAQICYNQHQCGKYGQAAPNPRPPPLSASVKRSQYRALKKAPYSRSDRMYYYIQSHNNSMSSPSPTSFNRKDLKKPLKRLDNRPCRLESECRCCDEKRLCKDYKHLADTSTEEWIVENCYSPRRPQLESPPKLMPPVTHDNHAKGVYQNFLDNLPASDHKVTTDQMQDESQKANKLAKKSSKPSRKPVKDKVTKRDNKKTKTDESRKNLNKSHAEDSFEQELQMAIKLSEELYNKEQLNRAKTQDDQQGPMTKDEIHKEPIVADVANDHIFVKPAAITKSPAYGQNATSLGTEETFFAFSKVIYNSTTVESDNAERIAKSKELSGNTNQQKIHDILPRKPLRKIPPKRNIIEVSQEDDGPKETEDACDHVIATEREDLEEGSTTRKNSTKSEKPQKEKESVSVVAHTDGKSAPNKISKTKRKYQTSKLQRQKAGSAEGDDIKEDHQLSLKDDRNKSKSRQKVQAKTLQQETEKEEVVSDVRKVQKEEVVEVAKMCDDHVFITPQARAKPSVNCINLSNASSEAMFFASPHDLSRHKQARKRQQINDDQDDIIKSTTTQMQTQQTNDDQEEIKNEKNVKATKTTSQKKQRKDNSKNKTLKKISLALSNSKSDQCNDLKEDFEMEEQRVVLAKQASIATSHSESNSISHKEKKKENTGRFKKSKTKKQTCKRQISEREGSHGGHLNTTKENKGDLSGKTLKKAKAIPADESDSETEYLERENKFKQVTQNFTAEHHEDDRDCSQNQMDKWNGDNTTSKKSQTMKGKKPNNISNVSSTTTLHSPEIHRSTMTSHRQCQRIIDLTEQGDDDDENDCTVVSSTTNLDHQTGDKKDTTQPLETTQPTQSSNDSIHKRQRLYQHPKKGILIYAPHNSTLAPAHSISNDGGFFTITQEHLGTIIGQKPAEKFLKYYIGRRRFNSKSTIYFRPPAVLDTSNASSSDSDDDDLEYIGRYGDLYESFGGGGAGAGGGGHGGSRQHS